MEILVFICPSRRLNYVIIASFSILFVSFCTAVSVILCYIFWVTNNTFKFITHYCFHVVCFVMGYVVLVDNLVMLLIVNL